MWCFRMVALAAMLFGGKAMCRALVTVVEFGGVFVTTPFAIYDGTATSTASVRSSTSLSSTTSLHSVSSPSLLLPSPPILSSSISPPRPSSLLPIFVTSPIPSSSFPITQIKPQIPTSSPESQTTMTTLTTLTTTPATATLSATRLAETTTPPPPPATQPPSINVAQIAGIAIGSSAIFGLVATFFFFVGRRNACSVHSKRHISMHNAATNLGSFRAKLGKFWGKVPEQATHSDSEAITPAELTATIEAREVPLPPERPINNLPYFYHPVTVASRIAGELEDSSTASYNPSPASRQQNQQDQILPVELPTSVDPGNSPLPRYEESNTAEQHRAFSWAAPESTYRPDKFEPGNRI